MKLISLLEQAVGTIQLFEPKMMKAAEHVIKEIEKALDQRDIHAPAVTLSQLQEHLRLAFTTNLAPIMAHLQVQQASQQAPAPAPALPPGPAAEYVYTRVVRHH